MQASPLDGKYQEIKFIFDTKDQVSTTLDNWTDSRCCLKNESTCMQKKSFPKIYDIIVYIQYHMPMLTCNVIDRNLLCYIVLYYHIQQDSPGDPIRNRSSVFLLVCFTKGPGLARFAKILIPHHCSSVSMLW